MQPVSADFDIQRGDSEAPAIVLFSLEPDTYQTGILVGPDDVVYWSLVVGLEVRTKTSAINGGLVADPDYPGVYRYPLTPEETQALEPAAYPYVVHVVFSDESEITPLVGYFRVS